MATPDDQPATALYIDGAWVPSTGTGSIDVIDSTTEEVMGTVPEGTAEDVDRAVAAARAAFPAWSARPLERADRAPDHGGRGPGAPAWTQPGRPDHPRGRHAPGAVPAGPGGPARSTPSIHRPPRWPPTSPWEQTVGQLARRAGAHRRGRAAITPWNYPLHQIAAKVAPALAAGCTVVVKPSEVAPLNAFVLAEIIDEVGVPAGVFNLVTGVGPVVGEAIAAHRDVDMVSFTGSTRAGQRVTEVAAGTVKRVALELGGKSANVILPDADLATAVPDGVNKCFLNSGQTCSALTRMLVPRDRLAEAEELARAAAESFTPGDPFDGATRLGPLVSAAQRDRVRGYIDKGIGEGATLVTGGAEAPDGLDAGLLRGPDRLLRRHPRHDHRPGGDLRPGAGASSPTTPRTRPSRSPTTPTTGWPAGSGPAMPSTPRPWPGGCAPVRSRSTAAASTRWPPSAATSSRATAASSASFGLEEFLEVKSLQL